MYTQSHFHSGVKKIKTKYIHIHDKSMNEYIHDMLFNTLAYFH